MEKPAPWQIIFALKAFAAAMLALYVAFALDLPRPYWAMTTVYVVSQPFAGAIRSKGAFRFAGTLLGGAAGIALYGLFGSSEVAMMAGLILWFYTCGYFALNDRSPRNYFFLLAGMTALLVGWPGSSTAGPIFDTAMARIEEIGLGILCAVIVDSIFFPRRIRPIIDGQIESWFADARDWTFDIFDGQHEKAFQDRAKLAADAGQIATMTVHLEYEMQDNAQRARWLRVLQQRMLFVLPVLSSIDDRLAELRRDGTALPEELEAILAELRDWLGKDAPAGEARRLKEAIGAFDPRPVAGSDWRAILLVGLNARLAELVDIWSDCRALWRQAQAPQEQPPRRLKQLARQRVSEPHRDRTMIAWAMGASFLSFLVAAAFWYFTGWPQGGTAAMMALLMSLFFGGMDDPLPMLRLMLKVLAFAVVLDALYLFIIMPATHSFPSLVIAFAPALIPLGLLASNPATFMIALMPIAMLTLQTTASTPTSFAPFVNGMLGMLFGVGIVLFVSGVAKSVSADFSARRILKAGWRDIARIAGASSGADRSAFMSRMLDRLGLLAPRLAAFNAADSATTVDALSDLRLGMDLIELQRRRRAVGGEAAERIGAILKTVSDHFSHLRGGEPAPAPKRLLDQLDETLTMVAFGPHIAQKRRIVLSLAGVRRALFPDAPALRTAREEGRAGPEPQALPVAAE